MFEVLFFYMFVWWFKKLEDKKMLTIRAVFAGIIGVFFWFMAFASISLIMLETALIAVVITTFCVAILLTVRFFCDIVKITNLNNQENSEEANSQNDNQRQGNYLSSKSNSEINEIEKQQAEKKLERDIKLYLALIEKCGIGFFIKYYRQISRLPLKDVDITESYSFAEREERLLAAKKIIDLGLSELALSEIIRAYDDILDKDLIDQARKILSEIQKGKSVTSDKNNAIKA